MEFGNASGQDVLLFVYDIDDRFFHNAIRDPTSHWAVLANAEVLVPAGQSNFTLHHTNAATWLIGVKRATGLGRFEPFIVPLTAQVYDTTARLKLTSAGTLLWLNAPQIDVPTPRLSEQDLMKPLPRARGHVIGVGKANVTDMAVCDKASKLPMQGWAATDQVSEALGTADLGGTETGRELPLQARAFIVGDPASDTRAVFVVVDIWSCSIAIKQEVVRRLSYGNSESPYRHDNIFIAGTHTHSAPAGYLHHFLYNATAMGFDAHTFESIVAGIVYAVEQAHASLAPGRVTVAQSKLPDITRNRSLPAFGNNPAIDTAEFPKGVDETMTVLTFEREELRPPNSFTQIGLLSWFAIHPTNRGKKSTIINGDNKGVASYVVEQACGGNFVAGFANSCAGDVSGNFTFGSPGFESVEGTDMAKQRNRMVYAGRAQATCALQMLTRASTKLTGRVTALEFRIDLALRTGAPAALGLSMAAGSVEDGGTGLLPEGVTMLDVGNPPSTSIGIMTGGAVLSLILLAINRLINAVAALLSGQALNVLQSQLAFSPVTDAMMLAAHFPKPIMLTPGLMTPDPWVPNVIPLQLVRIGTFAVLGVPAEVTTVAGRRLERAAASELGSKGVELITVGTYTNGYASYVTTGEEYEMQHYEGASTLFGHATCDTLVKATTTLARAATGQGALAHDAPLPDLRTRVLAKRRMTFRNLSRTPVRFRLYLLQDVLYLAPIWPDADFMVVPSLERAIVLPLPWSLSVDMVQVVWGNAPLSGIIPSKRRLIAGTSDLVLVQSTGQVVRSDYFPTTRAI